MAGGDGPGVAAGGRLLFDVGVNAGGGLVAGEELVVVRSAAELGLVAGAAPAGIASSIGGGVEKWTSRSSSNAS